MWSIFVMVFTLLYFSPIAEGCSCELTHPQEDYCRADFVILARVKRERFQKNSFDKVYKVRIRKMYKESEKAIIALHSGLIHTGKFSSMCGVDLQNGETYVLYGNVVNLKAHVNHCTHNANWRHLNRRERKALKVLYKQGCHCKIQSSIFTRYGSGSCYYAHQNRACYHRQGICLRQKNGKCNWTRNRELGKCLNGTTVEHFLPFLGS